MSSIPIVKPPKVAPMKLVSAVPIVSASTVSVPIITAFPEPIWEGELQPTIIHPDFAGLCFITGFRGSGKTVFGLSIDNPANICVIDLEDKGKLLAKPLGVGAYFQPLTEAVDKLGPKFELQAIFDRIMQIVQAIPKGRFTTLFLDNASSLQDGAAQYIRNNPSQAQRFGVRPENAISGGFGGAWPGVKYLMKTLFHLANSKGIQVIAVSFQLKGAWKDSKPLFNKFTTTNVSIWHEQSILTLVMSEPIPEYFPIPRAYVMKEQLSTMRWITDDVVTGRGHTETIRRIPAALPAATPTAIYDYLNNPADLKNPARGEGVTEGEITRFTPSFSQEQLTTWLKLAAAQKELSGGMDGDGED